MVVVSLLIMLVVFMCTILYSKMVMPEKVESFTKDWMETFLWKTAF